MVCNYKKIELFPKDDIPVPNNQMCMLQEQEKMKKEFGLLSKFEKGIAKFTNEFCCFLSKIVSLSLLLKK